MAARTPSDKPHPRLCWVLGDDIRAHTPGPNFDAARSLIDELTARKAVTAVDAPSTTVLLTLALAVDAMPADARLWGQYRQAIDVVRALDRGGSDDDDWTATVGASQVRDTPKPRTAKPRGAGGRGKPEAGEAADAVPAVRVGRGA